MRCSTHCQNHVGLRDFLKSSTPRQAVHNNLMIGLRCREACPGMIVLQCMPCSWIRRCLRYSTHSTFPLLHPLSSSLTYHKSRLKPLLPLKNPIKISATPIAISRIHSQYQHKQNPYMNSKCQNYPFLESKIASLAPFLGIAGQSAFPSSSSERDFGVGIYLVLGRGGG